MNYPVLNYKSQIMKRRDFIRSTIISAPMLSFFFSDLSAIARTFESGKLEKRSLGRTGRMLSVIGFGGIIVKDVTPEEASAYVKMAIDAGVNYFDVAPSYGNAEERLGPALEPYRADVFLACKTSERTKDGSRAELERSLTRLRTDHLDLYQLHAMTSMEDVKKVMGKGGAMETFIEAKQEGKIKHIGFSAHSVEAALALMDQFDFDTILYPVNYTTWYAGNFGPQVLARAQEKNMGILALKAMAKGPWPQGADRSEYSKCWYEPLSNKEDAKMGLRFTLSHPVTAALPPGEGKLFKLALELRESLKPLKQDEVEALKAKALSGQPIFKFVG
jgi:aryl-alcohol dehydrogenase-like predicted oxidoreductase